MLLLQVWLHCCFSDDSDPKSSIRLNFCTYQVAEQLSHVVSKDGEALPLFDINFHEHFIILVLQILQHMLIDMLQNYLLEVLTEILSFVKLVTNLKEDPGQYE
jgi:hypothetical protein